MQSLYDFIDNATEAELDELLRMVKDLAPCSLSFADCSDEPAAGTQAYSEAAA